MKHIQKTANGRKYSLDVEADGDEYFTNLANSYATDNRLKALVAKSWKGLISGCSPTLCESGVGGTYFMRDEFSRTVGVFKPQDEEMGCLNNPKGFTPQSDSYKDDSARRGVMVGEAAFRECAAYILDHEHFSGVPATDLVVCSHPSFNNSSWMEPDDQVKIGSFQEYKDHDFDAQDISPAKASKFSVREVHKIAILDIRLFNTDRHGGNILVRKVSSRSPPPLRDSCDSCEDLSEYPDLVDNVRRGYDSDADENGKYESRMQFHMEITSDEEDIEVEYYDSSDEEEALNYELIPIDHGYTLPHTLSGLTDSWFEWLNWPQSRVPFSNEEKTYIARLDADKDIALLRQRFGDWLQPECYKVLKITTMWLKIGAAMGLTPYDIGQMMCRKNADLPSELEKIVWEAEETAELVMRNTREGKTISSIFFEKLEGTMKRVIGNKLSNETDREAKKSRVANDRPSSRTLVFLD